jgi:hypothetical protein
MRINFSTFNYGGERPVPQDGSLIVPLDENGKIEPITDKNRKEFDRLYSLINDENFLGSLIPEKISIGLNNIRFDKDSQLFKINVQDQVYFPEDNNPKGEKSVNFVVKLDNLYKPKYKEISLYAEQDVNRFWDSISNGLKHWYPSVDKGLRSEADQENMINDIQRRSMTSLLDNIIMPSLQKHLGKRNEERIKHLERSLNNSPIGLSRYPEKVKIFNPQDPKTPLAQGSRRLKIHDKQISPSVSDLSKKREEEVLEKLRKADSELN